MKIKNKILISIICSIFSLIFIVLFLEKTNPYIENLYHISNTFKVNANFEKETTSEIIIEETKKENIATIYIGDSRTIGMYNSIKAKDNEYFIAEIGKGYNWLINEGISKIDNIITNTNYDNYNLVFMFGVNDLGNFNKYIELYNDFINNKYKYYNLYFCTVNPVIDGMSNATTNDVLFFNEKLSTLININTYDEIADTFNAPDGLHYDNITYKKIYNIINKNIETP